MLWGLIQIIFATLENIFWKKSLDETDLWYGAFHLAWEVIWIIFFIIFFVLWYIEFDIFNDIYSLILIFFVIIIEFSAFYIWQGLYKVNKISQLLPFENINKIFSIIIWFLIFQNNSIYAFIIAVVCFLIILIFSLDLRNFTLPKKLHKILTAEFLISLETLLLAHLLLKYSNITISMIWIIFSTILISLFLIDKNDYKKLFKQSSSFYKNRFIAAVLWWLAYLISLFLIKTLWIISTILLQFLWIWFTIILSYFILDDKPNKKDIGLSIILTILVWIWLFF